MEPLSHYDTTDSAGPRDTARADLQNSAGDAELTAAWTEAEVRHLLAQHEFTYQRVALPYGLSTPGTDRSATARAIFPDDLTGKSVFDVGCMYGYFNFEAEERGAARSVGGDVDPTNVAKCRLLASARGSKAEFQCLDIERDQLPGTFDYILCLNVLHHLRNPLSAIEKLVAATRGCLILEVASLTRWDARKLGLLPVIGQQLVGRLPVLYLGGAGTAKGASQTFFLTESATHTLLKKHRQDFARVDIKHGGKRERFIAVAHKRRIGHLYIVAGVNAVGKSTFLDSLAKGQNLAIAGQIGLDFAKPWSRLDYGELANETAADTPYMLLQYNISKHLIDGDLHRHERGLLDVIRCADQVSIVTFWHPGDKLVERYRRERVGAKADKMKHRADKKAKRLLALYGNPSQFDAVYADWFAFAQAHVRENHVVLQEPGYEVVSVDEWENGRRSR